MKKAIVVLLFIVSMGVKAQTILYNENHKVISFDFKESDKDQLPEGVYYLLKNIEGREVWCKLIVEPKLLRV